MRNVLKALATVGIAVALAVGPGVGMAGAAPLQIQPAQQVLPPDFNPIRDLFLGVNDLGAQVTGLVPEAPIPALPI